MTDRPKRAGSPRRAAAVGAALVVFALAASGCGEDLKNAVDTARSLQTQAQQQAQSVQSELNQQGTQGSSGGSGGYGY